MNNKIGIGVITCNSPEKLKQTAHLIPDVGTFVIVNDGQPYNSEIYPPNAEIIQHDKNYSVAKSKNDALKYLMDKGCEHLFIIEDDVIIKSPEFLEKYIRASKVSGIKHFNYALQGPNNRIQKKTLINEERNFFEKIVNLIAGKKILLSKRRAIEESERTSLDELSPPNPKYIHKYNDGISLSFYHHCVGALSYYHRDVLINVGYMDENFINAWEHIHHTYKIIKAGYHPPFWWFADLTDVEKHIDNIPDCMNLSTIAKSPMWKENVLKGESYFKSIEGITPVEIPIEKLNKVIGILKKMTPTH